MSHKLRILLADDHEAVREGLCMVLNAQPDMEVVGTARDGSEVIERTETMTPDVIVMDISMPGLNGLAATTKLVERRPNIKILTLTRHADRTYLKLLLDAGATGYLLKQSSPSELVNAVRTVAEGRKYLDPTLASAVREASDRLTMVEPARSLSPREIEVMKMIAWGASNKEIAQRLDLSVKTVEAHKANGMRKLSMRSRIDIVRYAILQGWLHES
ncbi:MAG TPA: response regulator transcription factor [Vicinamibacterales bacterium]|jgi:DNA-binding NarL/FixJ family response regulator